MIIIAREAQDGAKHTLEFRQDNDIAIGHIVNTSLGNELVYSYFLEINDCLVMPSYSETRCLSVCIDNLVADARSIIGG